MSCPPPVWAKRGFQLRPGEPEPALGLGPTAAAPFSGAPGRCRRLFRGLRASAGCPGPRPAHPRPGSARHLATPQTLSLRPGPPPHGLPAAATDGPAASAAPAAPRPASALAADRHFRPRAATAGSAWRGGRRDGSAPPRVAGPRPVGRRAGSPRGRRGVGGSGAAAPVPWRLPHSGVSPASRPGRAGGRAQVGRGGRAEPHGHSGPPPAPTRPPLRGACGRLGPGPSRRPGRSEARREAGRGSEGAGSAGRVGSSCGGAGGSAGQRGGGSAGPGAPGLSGQQADRPFCRSGRRGAGRIAGDRSLVSAQDVHAAVRPV